MAYLATTLDRLGCLDRLENFACVYGREFYGLPKRQGHVRLVKQPWVVPEEIPHRADALVPFLAKQTLDWKVDDIRFD